MSHPDVADAACIAHPADEGVDDEIKVWLVAAAGKPLDYEHILRFCVEVMPHFMVPRYFEQIDELPKTPSSRTQKFLLRQRGNGPHTWDRQAHGWKVTRQGLKSVTAGYRTACQTVDLAEIVASAQAPSAAHQSDRAGK